MIVLIDAKDSAEVCLRNFPWVSKSDMLVAVRVLQAELNAAEVVMRNFQV